MVFRKCSIGAKMYNGDESEETEPVTATQSPLRKEISGSSAGEKARSPPPAYDTEKAQNLGAPLEQFRTSGSTAVAPAEGSTANASDSTSDVDQATAEPKVIHHFRDAELVADIKQAVDADGQGDEAHARQLNGFFSVLALCHTVLTGIDKETGQIEYKAQSPDEAALVQAAADMGFVFRGRERETLYLQTPFHAMAVDGSSDDAHGQEKKSAGVASGSDVHTEKHSALAQLAADGQLERYELLNILEFTSARKRMSVVVRKLDGDDGRLFLLSKGADNVIFERLKPGVDEEMKASTERYLDEFASDGLRTLTLAYRVVSGALLVFLVEDLRICLMSFLQRMNISHGASAIMKRLLQWTIEMPKSTQCLQNWNATSDC
jgi:phospholipid-translocating ATPase